MNADRVNQIGPLVAAGLFDAFCRAIAREPDLDRVVMIILRTPVEEEVLERGRRLWEALLADGRFPSVIPPQLGG